MSLPSRDTAAASRPQRRSSDIVTEKGVRAGAKRFRLCFPGVNSKKKKGWKAQPDVGHSLCNDLRPSAAKKRKKLGCDDATNLNNRLKACCAIKCGKYSADDLKIQSAANLMSMGVRAKAGTTSTYFDLAVEIYNSENGA